MSRLDVIRATLTQALSPVYIDVVDESHKHVGHEGARDGRGHFAVTIASAGFIGFAMLARHRMVYSALGDLMTTEIHALSISALTPDEAKARALTAN